MTALGRNQMSPWLVLNWMKSLMVGLLSAARFAARLFTALTWAGDSRGAIRVRAAVASLMVALLSAARFAARLFTALTWAGDSGGAIGAGVPWPSTTKRRLNIPR